MKKNRLGRTNLEVTRWGLGGIPLSTVMGGSSEDEIDKVIHAALDYGINLIDTSRMYMDSETLIGEVMKTRRKECFLASKSINRKKDEVYSDIEVSLNELQTDKIEIYQIHALLPHEVETVMGDGGALQALQQAQKEGKIDYIGVTSHHMSILIDLMKTGNFDTVMFPLNIIEREPEKELISLAGSLDIGTFVMKPLAGGVIRDIDKCFRFLNPYPVDVLLNGVANLSELQQNLKCAENMTNLSPEELAEFEHEVSPLGKHFCRRCSYCMPCPNDIIIPAMIHSTWQKVGGRSFDELPPEIRNMGSGSVMWLECCTECGQCEEKCPYTLPTIQRKNELLELFSQ